MSWIIRFSLPQRGQDRASAKLWHLGTTGIAQIGETYNDSQTGIHTLESDEISHPIDTDGEPTITVIAGFDLEHLATEALSELTDDFGSMLTNPSVEPVDPGDWIDDNATGSIEEATFDVGGAFGHGSHPTTDLCLQVLRRLAPSTNSLCDFGTGTGVLSLAAAELGVERIVAVENDPVALEVVRRNVVQSPVPIRVVETIEGKAWHECFELVLANVLLPIHLAVADRLESVLSPGGLLVAAGLLSTQVDDYWATHPALERVDQIDSGEWSALVGRICK